MGCLFALLAGFFPRLALVVVWITTDLVDRAFDGWILPLVGLFFLPLTTLVYALACPGPGVHLADGRWLWVGAGVRGVRACGAMPGPDETNRDRCGRG